MAASIPSSHDMSEDEGGNALQNSVKVEFETMVLAESLDRAYDLLPTWLKPGDAKHPRT